MPSYCGKYCDECLLYQVFCRGCDNESCIVYQCISGQKRLSCANCPVWKACPYASKNRFQVKILDFNDSEIEERRMELNLPRFIPLIRPTDSRTFGWKQYGDWLPEAVVVRLDDIAARINVRKHLAYDKTIIASTIMPDKKLDELSPIVYSAKLKKVGVDLATTIDTYTYLDYPRSLSWEKCFETIKKTSVLINICKIPLIGIVKGATLEQVQFCVENLRKMGLSILGFPARELIEEREFEFISKVVDIIKKSGAKCILFGCSSPKLANRFGADHFSGFGWFRRATYGRVSVRGRVYEVYRVSHVVCECPFCQGDSLGKLAGNIVKMALHNLYDITSYCLHEGDNLTLDQFLGG